MKKFTKWCTELILAPIRSYAEYCYIELQSKIAIHYREIVLNGPYPKGSTSEHVLRLKENLSDFWKAIARECGSKRV